MAQGWIPDGSTTQMNPDNTMNIYPPTAWSYSGYQSSDGSFLQMEAAAATVSCKCNTSGSCDPFTISGGGKGTSGCAGGCTNCTMTQSVFSTQGGGATAFTSGGFLNDSETPAIISSAAVYPGPFEAMFDNPDVITSIDNFLHSVYTGEQSPPPITISNNSATVPDGFLLAFVNIWGRAVLMPIPQSMVPFAAAAGTSASCSCTAGSCTLQSKSVNWLGGATWCTGNCTGTCSLSTSIASGGGQQITYSADCYNY